ncbi:MAG: DUF7448 domain-containing protein [Candidatus Nanopelagicus sp.]
MGYMDRYVNFADLKDKVLKEVKQDGDRELYFTTTEGDTFKLYHEQDCCESVYIESIVGDLEDLVGWPILVAEHACGDSPNDDEETLFDDSNSWAFYKIATIKGYVDIRWVGSSNGYYSESVDFVKV